MGSNYVISNNVLDTEAAVELRSEGNFTDQQLQCLHSRALIPSVSTIRRQEVKLAGNDYQSDFVTSVIKKIDIMDAAAVEKLGNPIRLTVTADKGKIII